MIWTVTGGLGFIGSHFSELLSRKGEKFHLIDKQTYASNPVESLDVAPENVLSERYEDIQDLTSLPDCDVLVNFAAESHVDRSINESRSFFKSNVLGLHNIVDLMRAMPAERRPLLVHISTDEVFGDATSPDGSGAVREFERDSLLNPRNPYAASKAAAEHVVTSFNTTYDVDYVIVRMTNNYGVRQYPEKLIPGAIKKILNGTPISVHGQGSQKRDWLHVSDCVQAIYGFSTQAFDSRNLRNSAYHVAGQNLVSVNEVVEHIRSIMAERGYDSEVTYVADRYCQDEAYGLKNDWDHPERDIREDIREIIDWHLARIPATAGLATAA